MTFHVFNPDGKVVGSYASKVRALTEAAALADRLNETCAVWAPRFFVVVEPATRKVAS